VPSFGGVFYGDVGELGAAIKRFEGMEFRPAELQAWARRFSEEEFARRMGGILREAGSRVGWAEAERR